MTVCNVVAVCTAEVAGHREGSEIHADDEAQKLHRVSRLLPP